jgi:hypothetical protein
MSSPLSPASQAAAASIFVDVLRTHNVSVAWLTDLVQRCLAASGGDRSDLVSMCSQASKMSVTAPDLPITEVMTPMPTGNVAAGTVTGGSVISSSEIHMDAGQLNECVTKLSKLQTSIERAVSLLEVDYIC